VGEMGNRDRHDIVMEILEQAKSTKKKTELIRNVNLSTFQSKQYLTMLAKKGLLEIDGQGRYKTTRKGIETMEKCDSCFLCHWHKPKT
jgi:predicted transcriptional regulator